MPWVNFRTCNLLSCLKPSYDSHLPQDIIFAGSLETLPTSLASFWTHCSLLTGLQLLCPALFFVPRTLWYFLPQGLCTCSPLCRGCSWPLPLSSEVTLERPPQALASLTPFTLLLRNLQLNILFYFLFPWWPSLCLEVILFGLFHSRPFCLPTYLPTYLSVHLCVRIFTWGQKVHKPQPLYVLSGTTSI